MIITSRRPLLANAMALATCRRLYERLDFWAAPIAILLAYDYVISLLVEVNKELLAATPARYTRPEVTALGRAEPPIDQQAWEKIFGKEQ